MRIKIICPECSSDGYARFYLESIRDDGIYQGKCPIGHDVLVATQTLRHEMLFEIALNAIIDRYYREAVTSFSASAEQYYEFAIRVLAKKTAMPNDVLEAAWKSVAGQSERQFGAYVFLYASSYGQIPRFLKSPMKKLRNDVVHRGILPSREQAIEFGKEVHAIIQEGVKVLRAFDLQHVNDAVKDHLASALVKLGDRYPRATMVSPTALSITHDTSQGYPDFESILKNSG